jgi:hypothetical protein
MRHLTHIEICETLKAAFVRSKTYHDLQHRYYEGGLSSVYLWDQEDGGFAGVILIKKGTLRIPLVRSVSY